MSASSEPTNELTVEKPQPSLVGASRSFDALIAAKVMGLVHHEDDGTWRSGDEGEFQFLEEDLPRYSSDIAAAWMVVMELSQRRDAFGNGIEISVAFSPYGSRYVARVNDLSGQMRYTESRADTAPLALCFAALRACSRYQPKLAPSAVKNSGQPSISLDDAGAPSTGRTEA